MPRRPSSQWYKDAIIYEVHVKSFYDSTGDGRGDLRGLIEKLDYLESLGVTAVWLLPFYPSPLRDDGYDIADYRAIHPDYGSLRDFKAFVREAHRRGLRVITELVVNHTSDQHPWFQAARRARPGSAAREMYVWSDDNTRFAQTRVIFSDTESSNWTWDPVAGQYYWHRFFSHQPDLNLNNPRVVRAVIQVLRFWLKLGVDGLRLDAVPYLCVREGTSNENLPETHAVIREMRAAVDREFDDRMLLAEANQWPADVRAYFGDGDECHMAFHFPLMPRIFMAISQEDRRPITDIMDHTPDIPAACQWALFLRNHDELTLEMVTDEERDYMYRWYATDPRMRLNLGIRRRLAPLLANSMRRMELLNSLLFSFPGTPIVYYGDEIGMGDNIYLGDRDGVRTPMQWSLDRNAGFSRADPARLYLPVLMDPVWGYAAVNVEAQERNPSSLLHFMRRLISLRRQHKAFGRGSFEFLRPANRKILVYLRRWDAETILCVANLSRFAQPVELDLAEFRGWTPVEMIGSTEFPTIGELPYFLTLGPHAFYWFRLEPQPEAIAVTTADEAGALDDLPLLTLEPGAELLDDATRHVLEREVLRGYLTRRRWYRSKARELTALRLIDWCKLGGGFYVAIAEASFAEGAGERYVLPLRAITGEAARAVAAKAPAGVIARLRTPSAEGVICDALYDLTSCRQIYKAMAEGRRFTAARGGVLTAFAAASHDTDFATLPAPAKVRRLAAEQSNTSVVLDDASILKVFRVLETGPNPDLEIGLQLTERTDFRALARVQGGMTFQDASGARGAVAMLQEFVPSDGDAWDWALARVRALLAGARERGWPAPPAAPHGFDLAAAAPPAELLPAWADGGLPLLRQLGRRTGEFHAALAIDRRRPDFAPKALAAVDLEALADDALRQARRALGLLGAQLPVLAGDDRAAADAVLAAGPALLARFQALPQLRLAGQRIRVHGDFHLGQALVAGDDVVLIDFEGEPMRDLEHRRQKQSPLKDVAGLLRSLDYAGHVASGEAADDDRAPAAGWARAWTAAASAAFLAGHVEATGGTGLLPAEPQTAAALLDAFLLDKAMYELVYELNNRPDWVHVPLAGIRALIPAQAR